MDNKSPFSDEEIAEILGVPIEALQTKPIDFNKIREPLDSETVSRLFCEQCGLYHIVSPEMARQLGIEYTASEIGSFYITTVGCPFCRGIIAYFGPEKYEIPVDGPSE